MKTLFIVRGAPGSGKTTFVRKRLGLPVHEADQFFERDGEYKFDPTTIKDAHSDCLARVEQSMLAGNDRVAVSNTFTKLWEIQSYLQLAEKIGYNVRVIHIKSRFKSVHDVPQDVVERMISSYEPHPLDEEII